MFRSWTIIFLGIALTIAGCAGDSAPVELPPEPTMPGFTQELEQYREYYRLRFLPDGYPAKVMPDSSIFEHPIYGQYVLKDYLKQYRGNPKTELLDAINLVAKACVSRMELQDSSLIFWYPEGNYTSRAYEKHYSGLTQSYYMNTFWDIAEVTGDSTYTNAARQMFNSLFISTSSHGVYHERVFGASIEELPQVPNSYILNGWLSILWNIHLFHEKSGDPRALEEFEKGVASLERLILLYDHREFITSRYALTGPMVYRLKSSDEAYVSDIRVSIPVEGEIYPEVLTKGSRSDWQTFLFEEDLHTSDQGLELHESFRINTVLSRISYPLENSIDFLLTAENSGSIEVEVFQGSFKPTSTQQDKREWKSIGSLDYTSGTAQFSIPLSWKHADLISFPTAFSKKIDGKNHNVYHYVHIDRLTQILGVMPSDTLAFYRDKWEGYTDQWQQSTMYEGLEWGRVEK